MTVDVHFKSGTSNIVTVKVKEINWDMNLGPTTFSPATLKIIGDVFETDTGDTGTTTDRKLMNFILDFGKMSELITFTVTFTTNEDWKAFRKFAGEGAYFDKTVTNPIHVYWGASGDPFYLDGNDLTNLGEKYEGTFTKVNVTQRIPAGIWEGTVKFAIGKVMQI